MIKKVGICSVMLASLLTLAGLPAISSAADAAVTAKAHKKDQVVLQVSDADSAKWNLALNNVKNFQAALGKDNVDVEIVVYGPGIAMLKLDSEVGNRVDDAINNGAKIVACENTMKGQKLTKADMLPTIGYVPGGVIELMRKQQEGYAYIRP